VQEAPSLTEQALTGKFGGGAQAAALGLKGVGEAAGAVSNFFQTSAPDSVQQEAASAVKRGVRELKKIANLPPSQRTKAAARLTTQLGKVDQALAGYQQSEKVTQTRKRLRDLRRAVGRVTPGSGQTRKIQQGLQRGLDKQLTLLEEAESLDEVNAAMKNMRKMVSQNVVGSQ
jgi:soluble cytochrome b562